MSKGISHSRGAVMGAEQAAQAIATFDVLDRFRLAPLACAPDPAGTTEKVHLVTLTRPGT